MSNRRMKPRRLMSRGVCTGSYSEGHVSWRANTFLSWADHAVTLRRTVEWLRQCADYLEQRQAAAEAKRDSNAGGSPYGVEMPESECAYLAECPF